MRILLHKISKKCIALILTLTMLITLFSTYSFSVASAEVEEKYDRPWLWPVPGSYMINSLDTYTDGSIHNQGQALDIGSNGYRGTERLDVVSATDGTVFYIQKSYNETNNKGSGWGNYVVVKTGDTYILYAHLKTVSAKYGAIKAGDVIGKMGTTGNSTGVHLHMQAYPVGQASTSTDIHVFDKYIDNPLYAPKFQFWAGLQKNSVRYGEKIRQYYKNINETYYVYSGGRDLKFSEEAVSATVTTVNIKGTTVYAQPSFESSEQRTISNNTDVDVFGYHIDGYGMLWFNISPFSQDQWVSEKDVGFKKYNFTADTKDIVAPNDTYGTYADLTFGGNISTLNTITSVKAQIRKGYTVLSECVVPVNAKNYDIGKTITDALKIENMPNGTYTYELFVTVSASFPGVDSRSSTYSLHKSEFKINSLLADTIPPLVENISVENIDYNRIKLGANVTDDRKIESVKFTFEYVGGIFEATFDAQSNNDYYYVDVPITSLNGSGKYNVTATAYDAYGNSDSSSYVITIPAKPEGEVWVVMRADPSLRVRTGPGTSYAKAGNLYNGDKITVTEVVFANNYSWGRFEDGWCALEFCDYESGNMFEITFDLNGGYAEKFESSISKKYNEDITIPSTIPVKNGLTFLGWSKDPAANKETYKAGDIYSANESAVLYAIWGDTSVPVISDVSLSTTDWTKDGVVITINATDDSGTIFYSFDGGNSWRRENSMFVLENVELPVGTVAVKDPYGNVVVYNSTVSVQNIDLDAPVPSDNDVTVSYDDDGTKIHFDAATDALSGVAKYVLVYSNSIGFESTERLEVTNGKILNLKDGVYYAKLYIYDKIDNLAVVDMDRFLIGDPVNLNTPSNLKVKSSSTDSVLFVWDMVADSDLYKLYISENIEFTDPIYLEASNNTLTVTGLKPGIVYYAKIVASSTDNLFVDSVESNVISFETISSDNTIHSFDAYPDADIAENTVNAIVPYSDRKINLSLTVHNKSIVKIYSDSALNNHITSSEISFTANTSTVYIVVTAENGDVRKYTVTFTRAAEKAQTPNVTLEAGNRDIIINSVFEATLDAKVTDGGKLDIVWYLKSVGAGPSVLSRENDVSYKFDTSGIYIVYAVITNTNEKCSVKTATYTTNEIIITVQKHKSELVVFSSDKDYDGLPIVVTNSGYVGDGNISYKYYTDAACRFEVNQPVNAGTYYVKAIATETETYYSVESEPFKVTISRAKREAPPTYVLVRPSLRDRNGYITVDDEGVEYSINNGSWKIATPNESIIVRENDKVEIRYSVSDNYLASDSVELIVYAFNGTDDFYSNGNIDFTLTNEYMLINAHKITVENLISSLEKTENVYVTTSSGEEVEGYVYTSCIIMIKDDIGVFKSLEIVILGDLDGDGIVSYDDALNILMLSNGVKSPDDKLIMSCCDIDLDGKITSIDSCKAYQTSKT